MGPTLRFPAKSLEHPTNIEKIQLREILDEAPMTNETFT
jgi:hypothetical protein